MSNLEHIAKVFPDYEAVCFSQDPVKKKINAVTVYLWKKSIKRFFSVNE